MPIATVSLAIDQDTDFSQQWTWSTGSPPTPVNLTGATARSMVRVAPSDAVPTISLTTTPSSDGSIVLGGSAGTIVLTITKAATARLLAAIPYEIDMMIDWPGGTTTEFFSGRILVNAAVTH